jgi:hypothetical protein
MKALNRSRPLQEIATRQKTQGSRKGHDHTSVVDNDTLARLYSDLALMSLTRGDRQPRTAETFDPNKRDWRADATQRRCLLELHPIRQRRS